jgi:phosphoribosylanthranilate isomerase
MRTRIKVCCISSVDEATKASYAGADAMGLVGAMPSGPGVIDDLLIAEISKIIPPPIASFLLTSEQNAVNIIDYIKRAGTNTVQIVDEIPAASYQIIRAALPLVKIVQVVHVENEESILHAQKISNYADAILLDSGKPNSAIKILGGTGQVHNWNVSREIVRNVSVPVFLAGGLHALNVQEAIKTVKPFGVDICSGVRTNGNLDSVKLKLFVQAVQEASTKVYL